MSRRAAAEQVERGDEGLDLVASGSCGQWSVVIDETHSGRERRFAQIEGPSVYLSFEIRSVRIVEKLVQFFEGRRAAPLPPGTPADEGTASLRLGTSGRTPLSVLRDDEFTDRYYLLIGPEMRPILRYTIAGKDLAQLSDALRQAREELKSEGLLS
jgi:hypothetical protein